MIQPRNNNNISNANIQNFVNNNNAQLQESVYMDDIDETGFSLEDSPLNQNKFSCKCGKSISRKQDLESHSFECKHMQQDGYASFVQVVQGLVQQSNNSS